MRLEPKPPYFKCCRTSHVEEELPNNHFHKLTMLDNLPERQGIFPVPRAVFLAHSALPLVFVEFLIASFDRFQYELVLLPDLTIPKEQSVK